MDSSVGKVMSSVGVMEMGVRAVESSIEDMDVNGGEIIIM